MRTSIVGLTTTELAWVNFAVCEMLQAIMVGLKHGECQYVRFVFTQGQGSLIRGEARYYGEMLNERTPLIEHLLVEIGPRLVRYELPEGVSGRCGMDLLESEARKMCFAMTRGEMTSTGGAYQDRDQSWAVLFYKDGSEVSKKLSRMETVGLGL